MIKYTKCVMISHDKIKQLNKELENNEYVVVKRTDESIKKDISMFIDEKVLNIDDFFLSIGFKHDHLGLLFIKEGLRIIMNLEDYRYFLVLQIYDEIAKMYNTSYVNVEKDMRMAINHAKKHCPSGFLDNVMHGNKAFLLYICNYIAKNNLFAEDLI